MRKHWTWIAWFICLWCMALQAAQKDIVIMQTTDVHAVFEDGDNNGNGSWLRLATCMRQMQQQAGGAENTLIIDTGDNTQGSIAATLTKGKAGMTPIVMLPYDAWIPGNHELDYGFESFKKLLQIGQKKVLCGNLKLENEADLPSWRLFEKNGARIAVIGATSSFGKNWLIGEYARQVEFSSVVGMLKKILPEIHQQNPDMIILALHQGWMEGGDSRKGNEVAEIAARFPEIDLILGAHTHRLFPGRTIGQRTWYVQAGFHGKFLGVITATVDTDRHETTRVQSRMVEITTAMQEDPELKLALAPALEAARKEREKAIPGSLAKPVLSKGRPGVSSQTSQLICQAIQEATGADVALHGRLSRKDLPAGTLTGKDLYDLIPYENAIVLADVTREELAEIVAEQWRNKDYYGFCGLWGATAHVSEGSAVTAVITGLWNGEAWAPGTRRTIALNSHTAAGSGRFRYLRSVLDRPEAKARFAAMSTREAVENYLAKHPNLEIKVQRAYDKKR